MKNILLLCSVILFSVSAFSQSWEDLYKQVADYCDKGEYENALPVVRRSMEAAKKEFGIAGKNYFKSAVHYLIILNELEKPLQAVPAGIKASHEAELLFGPKDSIYLACLFQLGEAYKETAQTEAADSVYGRYVLLKTRAGQTIDNDYITALENFAENSFYAGSLEPALTYFDQIQQILLVRKDTTCLEYENSKDMIEQIRNKLTTEPKAKEWDTLDKQITKQIRDEIFFDHEELLENYWLAAKNEFGPFHRNYFLSLIKSNYIQLNDGSLQGSVKEYEQFLKELSDYFGENDTLYTIAISYLGQFYEGMNMFSNEKNIYERRLSIDRNNNDTLSKAHISNLSDFVSVLVKMENYKDAVPAMEKLMTAYSKTNLENDSVYLYYTLALAEYEIQLEHYSKALDHYLSLYPVIQKLDSSSGGRYLTLLNKIARTYDELGQYREAEFFYRESLIQLKNVVGPEHEYYFNGLNNIAASCLQQGKYTEAEIIFKQILQHDRKILRTLPKNYATTLESLANLYNQTGRYSESQKLYYEAGQNIKNQLGTKNREYALCLYNSALIDIESDKYDSAVIKLKEAITIDRVIAKDGDRHYLYYLQALARAYEYGNKLDEAEKKYKQADSIILKNYGKEHPLYVANLSYRGMMAMQLGIFPVAENLFKEAAKIGLKIYGKDQLEYAHEKSNLGILYDNLGRTDEAIMCFSEYERIAIGSMKRNFAGLSEKEKITFENSFSFNSYLISSLLYTNKHLAAKYSTNSLNARLQVKGVVLNESQKNLKAARSGGDKKLSGLMADWLRLKTVLAREYSLPVKERDPKIDSIENIANDFEKQISLLSPAFIDQQLSLGIGFNEIKNQLSEDEAVIEFISFDLYNKKWTDSIIYAAYIFRKKDTMPEFVPLFEEKQLQQLCDDIGRTPTTIAKGFYKDIDTVSKQTTLGNKLYKLIWEPLEPYLKGIKKIAYSPAGKLYGIAFNALPANDGKLLIDKYQFEQYVSTRQIALRNDTAQSEKPGSIVLFGGANFTMDSLALTKLPKIGATSVYLPENMGDRSAPWHNLPGTAEEAKKIGDLFKQNNISTKIFTEDAASEENLKALSGHSPNVLHIGTHGFFLPPLSEQYRSNDNAYNWADDPLLRNGLMLSGGNYAWSGRTPVNGVEDGVVTAYEISQLDLSNTELTTLSACETGLGDVKGSEGVFGLQRAFKMAGVKKMIVSLWQVPDKQTAELMTGFYSDWMNGRSIRDAFMQAQENMRKKYPSFYWAAFVLVE